MLVNLLGASEEALSKKYTHPFNDVPGWANDHVGYMYQNGLTRGISATMFEYNVYYDDKMDSLVRLTSEMYEIVTDEEGSSYIQFHKEKMPAELTVFTSVSIGTIGPSSIDLDLLLESEFAALGTMSRNGNYEYSGDPIRLNNKGNVMMSFYDDDMNLIGTGFFVYND